MDPAAVTGFFTLGGLLVGLFGNFFVAQIAERREAKREARVASRLLADDLHTRWAECNIAVKARLWFPVATGEDPLATWHEHQSALAATLPRQEWRLVAITFHRLRAVYDAAHGKRPDAELNQEDVERIGGAADYARRSQVMLAELSEHGPFSRKRHAVTAEEIHSGLLLGEPDYERLRGKAGLADVDQDED